jgi:hypothetical protein
LIAGMRGRPVPGDRPSIRSMIYATNTIGRDAMLMSPNAKSTGNRRQAGRMPKRRQGYQTSENRL